MRLTSHENFPDFLWTNSPVWSSSPFLFWNLETRFFLGGKAVTIQVLWARTTQLKYSFCVYVYLKNLNHDCHSKGILVILEKWHFRCLDIRTNGNVWTWCLSLLIVKKFQCKIKGIFVIMKNHQPLFCKRVWLRK